MENPAFRERMTAERKAGNDLASALRKIGPSRAVERFLSGYGNVRTKANYAGQLSLYFRWLKAEGVGASPDELVQDNLVCVFKSDPLDITKKRKHTDLLAKYANDYLIAQDFSESKRNVAITAIRGFYRANDSELVGHFKIANQGPEQPAKPLYAEDIRKVLLAMDPRLRAPLVISWQSGIEINRVLAMDFPRDQAPPVRIELYGRKGHKKTYSTFMGRDSVEHLRMLGPKGFPEYGVVWLGLKTAARKLGRSGLLKNPNLRSWRPHYLRHSFETEASHAGVKAEIRDFFLGHVGGVQWVYNHRDEIHPEDLEKEYAKIEPFVSLDYTKAVADRDAEDKDRNLLKLIRELQEKVDRMERGQVFPSASQGQPSTQPALSV